MSTTKNPHGNLHNFWQRRSLSTNITTINVYPQQQNNSFYPVSRSHASVWFNVNMLLSLRKISTYFLNTYNETVPFVTSLVACQCYLSSMQHVHSQKFTWEHPHFRKRNSLSTNTTTINTYPQPLSNVYISCWYLVPQTQHRHVHKYNIHMWASTSIVENKM